MRRDHWIEILRSTGVQTGQSRLHFSKNHQEPEREQQAHGRANIPARISVAALTRGIVIVRLADPRRPT
jgi:hypothetical protein